MSLIFTIVVIGGKKIPELEFIKVFEQTQHKLSKNKTGQISFYRSQFVRNEKMSKGLDLNEEIY